MASFRTALLLLIVVVVLLVDGCAARGTAPTRIEISTGLSPRSLPERETLRIATINMWGVVVGPIDWADHIDERFTALTARIGENRHDLDLILIQEAWKDSARRRFLADADVASKFPYRVDAVQRPGGAGLVLLSAFPVEDAKFLRFNHQGNCWKFWEGDCIAGKGALAAKVRVGGSIVWVANTHLIACYSAPDESATSCDETDANGEVRAAQIEELRAFLEPLSEAAPVLVGGDFNFTRTSRYYRAMARASTGRSGVGASGRWVETGDDGDDPNRIDYIWSLAGPGKRWKALLSAELVLTEPVELGSEGSVPLSDHPALATEFYPSSQLASGAAEDR